MSDSETQTLGLDEDWALLGANNIDESKKIQADYSLVGDLFGPTGSISSSIKEDLKKKKKRKAPKHNPNIVSAAEKAERRNRAIERSRLKAVKIAEQRKQNLIYFDELDEKNELVPDHFMKQYCDYRNISRKQFKSRQRRIKNQMSLLDDSGDEADDAKALELEFARVPFLERLTPNQQKFYDTLTPAAKKAYSEAEGNISRKRLQDISLNANELNYKIADRKRNKMKQAKGKKKANDSKKQVELTVRSDPQYSSAQEINEAFSFNNAFQRSSRNRAWNSLSEEEKKRKESGT